MNDGNKSTTRGLWKTPEQVAATPQKARAIPWVCMIWRELEHAKAKHPFFAHTAMEPHGSHRAEKNLSYYRHMLNCAIDEKSVSGTDVIGCELAEAQEAYSKGDLDHAIQEMAQVAAVAIRIMEMIEAEKASKA